jgi:hypothetical protein
MQGFAPYHRMMRTMALRKFPAVIPLLLVCLAGAVVPSALAQIIIVHDEPNGDSYACGLSGLKGMGRDCGTQDDEMVFTAEILSMEPAPGGEFRLTLRPITIFKGTPKVGVEVFTEQHRCLPEMKTGDRWLFSLYRDRESEHLIVNYGSRSGPEAEEGYGIALLNKLATLDHQGVVKGRAYFYQKTGDGSQEERPSSNHTILLTRIEDGQNIKTVTDKKGDFEFEPLPIGKYKLDPNTKPGLWTMWSGETDVEPHGCTYFDLDFHVDGQIAGRLVFPGRVDPSTWEVEATPADNPDVFPASDWTDSAGRFVLHGLEPGKYIVVFKKTEKRKGPNLKVDLFAPGTPDRSDAHIIELGKASRVEDVEFVIPRKALK